MTIALRPAAEGDIAEAMEWYDQQQSGLGDEFLSQVEITFSRIEQRPQGYPQTHGNFRRALVRRFSYTVYFRADGEQIIIFAIYHQRRDPKALTARLFGN